MSIDVYPPKGLLVPGTQQVTETLDISTKNSTGNVMLQAEWLDSVLTAGFLFWRVPASYASGSLTFTILRRGSATGVGIYTVRVLYFRAGIAFQTLVATTAFDLTVSNTTLSIQSVLTIPDTGLQVGDVVRIDVNRDGAHASDTIAGTVSFDGAYITYTATVPRVFNAQPYEEGSFTVTATGFSGTAPSGIASYIKVGKLVILNLPNLSGTSNANTFTITGLPAAITPLLLSEWAIARADNGVLDWGGIIADPGSLILRVQNNVGGGASWATTGTKSITATTITYQCQ